MTTHQPLLDVQGLTRRFDGVTALDGASCHSPKANC